MPVTLTIKQVPDPVADGLRKRAQANRRSLQNELLLIVEQAADTSEPATGARTGWALAEPAQPVYRANRVEAVKRGRALAAKSSSTASGKLSMDALWKRARKLGAVMPSESAAIVRRDRDARR